MPFPSGGAEVEAGVRVGGSFRVVMLDDATRIHHSGDYLTVDRTRLVLIHDRLPATAAASHEQGWGSMLDNLAVALSRTQARDT